MNSLVSIDHALHAMPQMRNTDGHVLEFHRLIYDVTSTHEAFEKLCDLCLTVTPTYDRPPGQGRQENEIDNKIRTSHDFSLIFHYGRYNRRYYIRTTTAALRPDRKCIEWSQSRKSRKFF
jgi:hypothetical protein